MLPPGGSIYGKLTDDMPLGCLQDGLGFRIWGAHIHLDLGLLDIDVLVLKRL